MLTGFKSFLLRGNLVELAVAVVIAVSFGAVVKEFTAVLMGFIGKIADQPDFSQVDLLGVNVGLFINSVVSFVILAAVVYFFVVVPYTKAKERFTTAAEAAEAEEVALLREIRDALQSKA